MPPHHNPIRCKTTVLPMRKLRLKGIERTTLIQTQALQVQKMGSLNWEFSGASTWHNERKGYCKVEGIISGML